MCQLGCTQCVDGTGQCLSCKDGFTRDANDGTKCIANQAITSTGTICPDGSFSNGTACAPCSPLCKTCNGPSSSNCIICGAQQYTLNGNCVSTDSNGVCQGSNMVADNNKHECDSCPAKCTTCGIPGFNVASTINQVQCTGCLPGFVLSQGQCVESCPSGTFVDPKDNVTCSGELLRSFIVIVSSEFVPSMRLFLYYLRWLLYVLSYLCQQPARVRWKMCHVLSSQHVQFVRILRHLSSRLRILLGFVVQSVHKLSSRSARPYQWPLPPNLQSDSVL